MYTRSITLLRWSYFAWHRLGGDHADGMYLVRNTPWEREEGGKGGRGSVMPKRLKSGFGHHRIESCGPSNGRHKIASDRTR